MDIVYSLFKGLFVLLVNIGFGYMISYCFHFYLFHPRKVYFFGKYHFYFSPGLLFRKKDALLKYIHTKLEEYISYTQEDYFHINFLTKFEDKIYHEVLEYAKKHIDMDWLPQLAIEKIEALLSQALWSVIYKFTRTIFPNILTEININQKIDKFDIFLDIYKIRALFEEHFFRYMLYFNLFFFFILGVINMVMFWILA